MDKKTKPVLSRAAFEALVRSHHAAVYASAARLLRDEGAALDVTQDVFVALLEGRIVLQGGDDERVLRWFAIKRSLQVLRERAGRARHEERYAMEQPEGRPDESVASRDAASAVARALERLPADLRAALQLRFHEGLTLARVGEALEISEPAAHERVKRGLSRLREILAKAGFAGVAIDVEGVLQTSAGSAAAPQFVLGKLLALHAGARTVSLAAVVLAAGSALAVLVLGFEFLADRREVPPVVAGGAAPGRAVRESEAERQEKLLAPAGGAPAERAPATAFALESFSANNIAWVPVETEATITGRLVDDAGRPAPDLVVIAESTQRDGKLARWAGRGRAGRDGRFEIPVPVGPEGETTYELVLEGRLALEESAGHALVRARTGTATDAGTLRLAPRALDQPGAFELDVRVADSAGRAVEGARVTLWRGVRSPDGWSDRTFEVSGTSDAQGRVRLAGEHVGAKHLLCEASERGFAKLRRPLALGPGGQVLELVLEAGLEIQGRLTDVDGRPVARDRGALRFGRVLQLHARPASARDEWVFAEIEDDGSFRFRGLSAEDHELGIGGGPWSPICLAGVRPPRTDLVLALKRDDDPLDRGVHCAEIHARLVDAHSRSPVSVDIEVVEAVRLPPGTTPAEFETDLFAELLHARPVQREGSGEYPPLSERVRATGLEAGTWAFVVRAPGYAPELLAPLVLKDREIVSDRVLALVPPARIAGRVLDTAGRPVAGALVGLTGRGPASDARVAEIEREIARTDGHPSLAILDLVETGADGTFAIEALSPRFDAIVWAFDRAHAPVASGVVRGSSELALELRFTTRR